MFRLPSGSTARKNSFAQRRGTLRSVVFHLSLALALLTVGPAEHARAPPLCTRRRSIADCSHSQIEGRHVGAPRPRSSGAVEKRLAETYMPPIRAVAHPRLANSGGRGDQRSRPE